MQKKFKEKYNEGCIKIFTFLKLLYEDNAYYDDVMRIFMEDDEEKQHVILNKYLNTLKVFGIKVNKVNNKFVMKNSPFSLKFDLDDLKSVSFFQKFQEILPNGKTKHNLDMLLKMLESRFDDKTNLLFSKVNSTNNTDFSFYYSDIREQIEECEKICQEQFKVNIKYLDKNKEVNVYCNAKQVIYDNKNAYLRIYKINENEVSDILISNIVSINQLPTKKSNAEMSSTVVYKIKGRLAKAYNLKENEYVSEVLSDGSKIIINKDEPTEILLKRLIRYDYDCIIISPKSMRNKMIEMINDTLKNYE